MNQEKLAKKLGCCQARVSNFKNDKVEDCPQKFYEKMVRLEEKLKKVKK